MGANKLLSRKFLFFTAAAAAGFLSLSSSLSSSSSTGIVDETLAMQFSHPLAQFAVFFAAMVHDVDHPGVPNAQLVKEPSRIAVVYNNKSVAEQNSADLAWSVLMDAEYKDLQAAIYANQEELLEWFRRLVVNAIMATDLFDPELIEDREQRWLAIIQAWIPRMRDRRIVRTRKHVRRYFSGRENHPASTGWEWMGR
jgi:hypothetical protein